MKYVIVRDEYGFEVPIIFAESINYKTFKDLKPISAGFCEFETVVSAWGHSVGLNMDSRPHDRLIICAFCGLNKGDE